MRPREAMLLLAVAVLLSISLHIGSKTREPGPLVWLTHGGAVRGQWCRGSVAMGLGRRRFAAFRGIPYAEAPVGDRRFAPPQPVRPWRGERSAECEGAICPQPSAHPFLVTCPSRVPPVGIVRDWLLHVPRLVSMLLWSALRQREDCLFVNVFVAERGNDDDDDDDHPADGNSSAVLVWLHGGAFLIGDGSAEEYGPELLVDHGVIVVTLNYRLGVLGFLYGGPESGAPGNMGLRDQALALRWVRHNIAAFGGDPARVTLWGESAGAVSAHLHTMAAGAEPDGRELFQRLILSSGVATLPWAVQESSLDTLRPLADALGWPSWRLPGHARDLVKFLRKVPAEQIVASSSEFKSITNFVASNGMLKLRWLPVVEEQEAQGEPRFLAQSPAAILAEGTSRSVPTMLGVNSREGMVLMAARGPRDMARLLRRIDADFSLVVADLPFVRQRGQGRGHGQSSPAPAQPSPWLPAVTPARAPAPGRRPTATQLRRATHLIRSFFFGRQRVSMRTLPAFLDLYSDLIFNIGVREAVALHVRWAPESSPLYLYRFSFDGQLGFLKRLVGTSVPGVGHADELGYLFNMKVLPPISLHPDSAEMVTRRRLVTLWTNFVKYGDPTPELDEGLGSVRWQSNSAENDYYLDIDANLTIRKHMFESRTRFWSDLYRDVLGVPLSW